MRMALTIVSMLAIAGCGAEVATTAVTVGKMQADQAKQGQQMIEQTRSSIETSMQAAQQKMDEAANKQ